MTMALLLKELDDAARLEPTPSAAENIQQVAA